ncbi:MAG: glycosyltransferase family 2 protein [Chloroflexi bacterium]|nr:MAG: glycosyltransferase family 2 protein [Chloroflexota bacterium]
MITVVIPTYRRPRLLARAIRSVLAQTDPNFAVCVYDNASGDETAAVVATFMADDRRIHYCAHQTNIGATANINQGMDRVASPYFTVLSDDDVLLPTLFERAMATYARYPDAMFVSSPVLLVDPLGRVLKVDGSQWPTGLYRPPAGLSDMVDLGHFIWTGTVFRRELVQQVGVLDPAIGSSADLDFQLRIASHHPFATVSEPGALFSWHPASPSSHPDLDHFWPGWQRIIDKIRADDALPAEVRRVVTARIRGRLMKMLVLVGLYASTRGRFDDAAGAADVLRRGYRAPVASLAVRATAALARWLPPFRAALRFCALRIWWRGRYRLRPVQLEFDRRYRRLFRVPPLPSGVRKDSAA